MEINVYSQYFEAEAVFSGVERKGALVLLVSDSEAGNISYKAAVTFFPHSDEEDFAVSYDAYFEAEMYRAAGRRSRKREAALLEQLRPAVDALARGHGASVLWDKPFGEPRMG